ncbi:MAG: PTS system fructose subfamily IIA component [Erysipelotrichaceae bacterium]|nr:MAG: PTS system fructose subfamily IIA [Erysipelotrichaceae bacterium]TXT19121.1 MAG: PTS system fructose subfamily IIA component [Erysipelotrichaceae bacterium]
MTKLILVAHGDLGNSFLRSVTMIAGDQNPDEVAAISFSPDDSLDTLKSRIEEQLVKFNPKENHIIVCCDLKAGTPFNASYLLSKKYPLHIVSGTNLPLLLELVMSKDTLTDLESINDIIELAKTTISVM